MAGIGAGGSFTDCVLLEMPGTKVIQTTKVPTEKGDLPASVLRCFSALSIPSPFLLSRLCVSTILATNAMVGGTRKDVFALCIGIAPKRSMENTGEVAVIDGRHDPTGPEVRLLGLPALRSAIHRCAKSSFVISARFEARNPEHELIAYRGVLEACPQAIVVRGSDLTRVLGMEDRLYLAAKNAELIHVMRSLMKEIAPAIAVPESLIYFLKGDGSLVSTEEATLRPILRVEIPVVGIGAPVHSFLDLVTGWIDCPIIIPPHHEVGNAMGAVCTEVLGRMEVMLRYEPGLVQGDEVIADHATTGDGQKVSGYRERAVVFAIEQATDELREYMEHSGIRSSDTKVEVRDITCMEWSLRKVAETVVSMTTGER
ncbi:MAG: hydantoinase/oxoprolinase N-terminal domain-containing protein [Methanomassiliicoccus sp.]|nr:hydantoinase/oxoprolinase N-terminal domain-containing protein [Methanomassiliicoccus sp.]